VESHEDEIFKRSAQEKFGIGDEMYFREKIAFELRRSTNGNSPQLDRYQKEDTEKRITLDFARQHQLWIDDFYSLGLPLQGGGIENTLAINLETGVLYKSNNLFNSNFLISNLLEQIKIHHLILPDAKYELVGFTGIDYGIKRIPYIEVVLKQAYIPNLVQATPKEIAIYMKSIGFHKIDETTFVNENFKFQIYFPEMF